MEADEAFAERVKDTGGPQPALALLRSEGFEVTQQDMKDAFLARYGKDLTDEQLDAIEGGVDTTAVSSVGFGVGLGLPAAAGVAYVYLGAAGAAVV